MAKCAVVDLQVRGDPGGHVVGHVGLGRPEPGVQAQRVAQARPGGVGHDHHRREAIVRGGERVHHGREPPGQQPVLRAARLAGDQHQHRQLRAHRAQVGRRQVKPGGPGREPRTPARDRHRGDPPGARHARRDVPGPCQRLPRAGRSTAAAATAAAPGRPGWPRARRARRPSSAGIRRRR